MLALVRSRLLAALVTAFLVFLGVLGLRISGNLESLELAAYDWHIRMRATPRAPSPHIVLVLVTEKDINELKQWPLSDAVLAHALQTLSRNGARAIGVDIYRDVPVPPGYEELEEVLTSNPQIIGAMKFPHEDSPGVAPPPVLKDTQQVGFTDMLVDPGGIVRRGLLFLDDGQTVSYSMALRAALLYLAAEEIAVQGDPDNPAHIRFGSTTLRPFEANDGGYVHADAAGYQFMLDYRDRPDSFPSITLTDLLIGNFDPALFKDKVVLIGVTSESVKDLFYTPHSRARGAAPPVYGVALHAHAVSQLLRAGLHGDAPVAVISDAREALCILLWSLLGGILALLIRSPWRFTLAAVGGLVLLAIIIHGFFNAGLWIPLIPPAMAWVGSAGVVMAYVSSQEKKERVQLMGLFSSHLSPQLAESIWEDRDEFLSGGRPRPLKLTATVFFSDLTGFTTVAEKMEPHVVMDWLNDCMEVVTPLFGEHGGVILRFIGDSIMAVFGVPVARTSEAEIRQDAVNAIECSLAIEQKLIQHNRVLKERGEQLVGMRIGILTGPMVAGDVGSKERLEYNVHGDTVNTAARLESFESQSFVPDHFVRPCRILVGEATLAYLDDQFETELIGEAQLKGKAQAIRVYRVIGRRDTKAQPERDGTQAESKPSSQAVSGAE